MVSIATSNALTQVISNIEQLLTPTMTYIVNEHGVVHQTTTLSTTIDGSVVCLGSAETRDR